MNLIFKVQFVGFLFFCQKVFAGIVGTRQLDDRLLYRYEGNFYPVYATRDVLQRYPRQPAPIVYLQPVQLNHQIYHDYHGEDQVPLTTGTDNEYQVAMKVEPLQRVDPSGKPVESNGSHAENPNQVERKQPGDDKVPRRVDSVNRHYHDIFVKLESPHDLVFGHVLNWPNSAEKKIETRRGNNYKGQVVWADRKGGYGEHYWDLAQGAL